MEIELDITAIQNFFNQPIDVMAWKIFWLVGWIPVAIILLWGFKEIWLVYIRRKWGATQKSILLAIDVPRDNMQSPKAVENLLSYLAGAHTEPNLIEIYWQGVFQLSFSFEIVSIDGYIQFLIRTPEQFRNLVESAVYAQYPDAEITEVNDYTEGIPTRYPDEEYDVWGCEFIEKSPSAYPIKTYKEFEHQFGEPETFYKDPMAALMDLLSSLRKGEQLWFQIILIPIGFDWPKIGDKEISKILKEKTSANGNIVDQIAGEIGSWWEITSNVVLGTDVSKKEEKKDEPLRMLNLKPKEKKQVESIQMKVSKLGFGVKTRFVYVAKREVFNKPKAVNGFVGYIKQFAAMDLNNLKPDMKMTATRENYFFKQQIVNAKKNRIVNNYKKRDDTAGRQPYVLNVEEIASIWHFPIEAVVKAPLMQRAPGRKAEPPMTVPYSEEVETEMFLEPVFGSLPKTAEMTVKIANINGEIKKSAPPDNLPVA